MPQARGTFEFPQSFQHNFITFLSSDKIGSKNTVQSHQNIVKILFSAFSKVVKEGLVRRMLWISSEKFTIYVDG